jgi:hypothetical protein
VQVATSGVFEWEAWEGHVTCVQVATSGVFEWEAWEGHVTCVQVATSGVFEWEAWEVTLLACKSPPLEFLNERRGKSRYLRATRVF